jgi:hypothetical protein
MNQIETINSTEKMIDPQPAREILSQPESSLIASSKAFKDLNKNMFNNMKLIMNEVNFMNKPLQ